MGDFLLFTHFHTMKVYLICIFCIGKYTLKNSDFYANRKRLDIKKVYNRYLTREQQAEKQTYSDESISFPS